MFGIQKDREPVGEPEDSFHPVKSLVTGDTIDGKVQSGLQISSDTLQLLASENSEHPYLNVMETVGGFKRLARSVEQMVSRNNSGLTSILYSHILTVRYPSWSLDQSLN